MTTLDGWWGNRESTRFAMLDSMTKHEFIFYLLIFDYLFIDIDRDNGANGFRVSNPSIHQCATLAASLEV